MFFLLICIKCIILFLNKLINILFLKFFILIFRIYILVDIKYINESFFGILMVGKSVKSFWNLNY